MTYREWLRRPGLLNAREIESIASSIHSGASFEEIRDTLLQDYRSLLQLKVSDAEILKIPSFQTKLKEVSDLFKEYEDFCHLEYTSFNDAVRGAFESVFNELTKNKKPEERQWKNAEEYYKWIRVAYVGSGYAGPHSRLDALLQKVEVYTFLGCSILVHHDFKEVLRNTLDQLVARNPSRPNIVKETASQISRIGGFRPTQIAASTKLSYHGIGMAIDIDSTANPVLSGEPAKAIDAILMSMQSPALLSTLVTVAESFPKEIEQDSLEIEVEVRMAAAEAAYAKVAVISEHLKSFLNTWLPQWGRISAPAILLLERLLLSVGAISRSKAGYKRNPDGTVHVNAKKFVRIERLRQHGIVTIPRELFTAFYAASTASNYRGRSGAEYHGTPGKPYIDVMHFELVPISAKKKSRRRN